MWFGNRPVLVGFGFGFGLVYTVPTPRSESHVHDGRGGFDVHMDTSEYSVLPATT